MNNKITDVLYEEVDPLEEVLYEIDRCLRNKDTDTSDFIVDFRKVQPGPGEKFTKFVLKVAHKNDGINNGLEIESFTPVDLITVFLHHFHRDQYFESTRKKNGHLPDFYCKERGYSQPESCKTQCGECITHNPFPTHENLPS